MNPSHLAGKTVLVTGGTGGIGRATALELARLGAHVVVVGRDRHRGEAAVARLRRDSGQPAVELLSADLSSLADVRALATAFQERHDRLHILVNNAGALTSEHALAVNHLAPLLLTLLLLPTLQASAPARVVNLTSDAHRAPFARFSLDDLDELSQQPALVAYGRSKLASLLANLELARRLESSGVTILAVDPGRADTPLTSGLTKDAFPLPMRRFYPVFRLMRRLSPRRPEQAARSSIRAASAADLAAHSGQILNPKGEPAQHSRVAQDPEFARRVWEWSVARLGPDVQQNAPEPAPSEAPTAER